MNIKGWKCYNHAVVPSTPPTVETDISCVEHGDVWKLGGVILARWTSDFDCGYETNWWYVIKDSPFDISVLKAKRRYEINKGIKNFDVKQIKAVEYKNELLDIQSAAFATYLKKCRPVIDKQKFLDGVSKWNINYDVFGLFAKDDGKIAGYALLAKRSNSFLDFTTLKVNPAYEKLGANAAMVNGILEHYADFLSGNGMICDGSRSVNHETKFQDYLEKYFGFRKAYCKLNVVYNPKYRGLIKLLYHFRNILKCFDNIGTVHGINGILKMEDVVRGQ